MPEELQARPEPDTLERSAWFTFDTGNRRQKPHFLGKARSIDPKWTAEDRARSDRPGCRTSRRGRRGRQGCARRPPRQAPAVEPSRWTWRVEAAPWSTLAGATSCTLRAVGDCMMLAFDCLRHHLMRIVDVLPRRSDYDDGTCDLRRPSSILPLYLESSHQRSTSWRSALTHDRYDVEARNYNLG